MIIFKNKIVIIMIFTLGFLFINFEHHFNTHVFINQSAMDRL